MIFKRRGAAVARKAHNLQVVGSSPTAATSFVRFATLCAKCGRRSEEYTAWPTCRVCMQHFCGSCDVSSQRCDDERNETLCRGCALDDIREAAAEAARWILFWLIPGLGMAGFIAVMIFAACIFAR